MTTFYKVITDDMIHKPRNSDGFQFKLGLNILTEPFDPRFYQINHELFDEQGVTEYIKSQQIGGGFHFCEFEYIHQWIALYDNTKYIMEVGLCHDSQIAKWDEKCKYHTERMFKTDKLILKNPMLISEFLEKHDLFSDAVRAFGIAIKYVPEHLRTESICIDAIKRNWSVIKYIPQKYHKDCLDAIKGVF